MNITRRPTKKATQHKAPQSRGMSASLRRLAARSVVPLLSGLLLAGGFHTAQAAALNWDPGQTPATPTGGTGTWDTTNLFWSDGTNDFVWPNTNADTATFAGTAGTVTVSSGIVAGGLTFNTDAYTLTGGTLALSGTATVGTGITSTINSSVSGSFIKAGTGTLVLGGTNTFAAGTTINFAGEGGNNANNDGTILLTSSGALGTNALTIGGASEVSGAIAAVSLSGGITIGNNVTIRTGGRNLGAANAFLNNASGDNTYNGNISIANSGGGYFVTLANAGETLTLGGTITNNNSSSRGLTFFGAGNALITGTMADTGGTVTQNLTLGRTGNLLGGTVTLAGNQTYSGPTTINSGTLQVGNGGTLGSVGTSAVTNNSILNFNRSDTGLVIGGIISGTGTVNQIGTGTTSLTGANTYSGTTTISAGTLQLGNGGATGSLGATTAAVVDNGNLSFNRSDAALTVANVISGTGVVTQAGTGTTTLTGANTNSGGTTVNAGTLKLDFSGTGAPTSDILATGSALTLGGGTLNVNGATGATNSQTLGNLTLNGGASTISMTNNGATSDALTFTGTLTPNPGGTIDFIAPTGTSITFTSPANQNKAFLGSYAFFSNGASTNYAATDINGLVGAATLTPVTGVNGFVSATTDYAYTSPGSPDQLTANRTADTASFNTAGAQTIDLNGANTLTLNGFLNTGGALTILNSASGGAGTLTIGSNNDLVIGGSSAVTISAPIVNGTAASALTNANTGTLTLTGTNTYTGGTTLGGGTTQISSAANLGDVNGAATISNAILEVLGGNTISTARNFFLGSTNSTFQVDPGSSYAISGVIADVVGSPGTLNTTGTGTLTLTGANTYSGGTNIGAGTLQVGNGGTTGSLGTNTGGIVDNGTLVINHSDAVAIANVISGTGSLTQAGTGTTTLSGANTYAGGTTINSGILNANTDAALGGAAGPLTFNGGTLQAGGAFTTARGITLNATGTVDTNGNAVTASGAISGAGGLTKNGLGTLTLSGANTYAGNTNVNQGGLTSNTLGTASPGTNDSTLPGGAIVNVANGAVLNLNNTSGAVNTTINYNNFTLNLNGGNSLTFGGGNITTYNVPGNITLTGTNTITTENIREKLALSGVVSGSGDLIFSGGGAQNSHFLTLSGANTYGGSTTVTSRNGGTSIQLSGGDNRLPTGTILTLNASASNPAQLDLNGLNQTLAGLVSTGTVGNDAVVNSSATASTLTINNSGADTYGGVLGAPAQTLTNTPVVGVNFSLAKTGAGTLTLSGANGYTGGTTISGGTLAAGSSSALGTGDAAVSNGATLQLGNGVSVANNVSLNGTGDTNTGALTTTGGASTVTGIVTAITNATISSGGGTLNLNGGVVKNGTTLTLTGGGAINVNSVISGANLNSDMVVDGTTTTFSTQNTYNGPTTVQNAGTLILAAPSSTANNVGAVPGDLTVTGTGSSVQLNASDQIALVNPNTSIQNTITLNQGTFNANSFSEGAANGAAAPTTGMGALALTNLNGTFSFLDFGPQTGSNALAFADSSGQTWSGNLQVNDYQYDFTGVGTPIDHLFFGTTASGLTAGQLGQISFVNVNGQAGNNFGAQILGNGEVALAPTPEPGSLIPLLVGMAGLGVLIARKRRKANTENCKNELAEAV